MLFTQAQSSSQWKSKGGNDHQEIADDQKKVTLKMSSLTEWKINIPTANMHKLE